MIISYILIGIQFFIMGYWFFRDKIREDFILKKISDSLLKSDSLKLRIDNIDSFLRKQEFQKSESERKMEARIHNINQEINNLRTIIKEDKNNKKY